MEPIPSQPAGRVAGAVDRLLVSLVSGSAFALGCQEMVDSDVWWHVRAGRWIWEHRRFPGLDPFSFASADRPWVDLHWIFQLMLAAAHGAGGASGIIVMAAGLCAAVAAVAVTARDRRWPMWVVAACWLPALVLMSARSAPRPELLSLLATATYLAILRRADGRPAWLWLLPAVQVVWVNAHGLFVLGPILLGLHLADRVLTRGRKPFEPGERSRLGWIAAAVVLACLVNPYGWRGTLLPLELFPKITTLGGLYKSYIVEFMDLREFVARQGTSIAAANLYNRVECFLFWVLPLSWILPSAWRAARDAGSPAQAKPRAVAGVAAFVLAVVLVLVGVMGLPAQGTSRRLIECGRMAPIGLAATGVLAGVLVFRRSRRAAMIAVVGGLATASWMIWLRSYLFGPEPASLAMAMAAGLLGIAAAWLSVRDGARPFRIGLATAFGYLALQAIRNANLFGLAAGSVLAANLGEWASELSGPRGKDEGLAARLIVVGAATLLIVATVTGWLFRATGERRAFGLSASPLAYAHDAARFAGRPGLPEHALVYSLRQAGVYVFHNGPDRKVFLDGRLEVPAPETFADYVGLERQIAEDRGRWSEALRRLGDPLILLDHEGHAGAEATLLTDPGWRCVYYDGVGSVFLSRRRRDLEGLFPTVDFLSRHCGDPSWRSVPARPWGLAEGRALLGVAEAMRGRPGAPWSLRAAMLLTACDRFRQAIAADPTVAGEWALLGEALENLAPDSPASSPPPGPDEPWEPARSLLPAQSTACYRRALERDPGEIRALFALYRSFGARRMLDARASVASMMKRAWAAAVLGDPDADPGPDPDDARRPALAEPSPVRAPDDGEGHSRAVEWLIRAGRPEGAAKLVAEAADRGIIVPWPARDRVATALLHLGRPDEARGVWLGAADPPSRPLQLARAAAASLAALDFVASERDYRAALEARPDLGEAWLGLAILHAQRGEPAEARDACHHGLRGPLAPDQRAFLMALRRLLEDRPSTKG